MLPQVWEAVILVWNLVSCTIALYFPEAFVIAQYIVLCIQPVVAPIKHLFVIRHDKVLRSGWLIFLESSFLHARESAVSYICQEDVKSLRGVLLDIASLP